MPGILHQEFLREPYSCLRRGRMRALARFLSILTNVPCFNLSSNCSIAERTRLPMCCGDISWVRTCNTLGASASVEARIVPKSRSCVNTIKPLDLAHVMITRSGALAAPTSDQWTALCPASLKNRTQCGDRFMSITIFMWITLQ